MCRRSDWLDGTNFPPTRGLLGQNLNLIKVSSSVCTCSSELVNLGVFFLLIFALNIKSSLIFLVPLYVAECFSRVDLFASCGGPVEQLLYV